MFIEPTITWVPSGFSGYIWLDTKIVLKKKKKKREQRAVRYVACATGWIPDFHSTRRQPATAAGVRRRGRAQVHGVNVNNIIQPTNIHTENCYAAYISAAADEISSLKP